MPSSSTTTSKSVAFSSSLCQTQDGKVKIIEKDDENLDDESGSTYPRRTSIPDSDTDASRDKQVLFSGLYPVVMVGLKQTTRPRIWCLRMIENPYPLFVILIIQKLLPFKRKFFDYILK